MEIRAPPRLRHSKESKRPRFAIERKARRSEKSRDFKEIAKVLTVSH